jgi:hypothetical protein
MAEITSPKRLPLPDGSTGTRGPRSAAGDGPGLEALAGNTTTPGEQ